MILFENNSTNTFGTIVGTWFGTFCGPKGNSTKYQQFPKFME